MQLKEDTWTNKKNISFITCTFPINDMFVKVVWYYGAVASGHNYNEMDAVTIK